MGGEAQEETMGTSRSDREFQGKRVTEIGGFQVDGLPQGIGG